MLVWTLKSFNMDFYRGIYCAFRSFLEFNQKRCIFKAFPVFFMYFSHVFLSPFHFSPLIFIFYFIPSGHFAYNIFLDALFSYYGLSGCESCGGWVLLLTEPPSTFLRVTTPITLGKNFSPWVVFPLRIFLSPSMESFFLQASFFFSWHIFRRKI